MQSIPQGLSKEELLRTLEAAARRKLYRAIDFFEPYPKQQDFFDLGTTKRERLLMAGNQLGKTYAGAAEMTYHLTGDYPVIWNGRRYDRAVRAWACGQTSLLARDVQQKLLFGEPGVDSALGTGMVPKDAILDVSLARGITDAYDTVQVKHKSGGVSILKFKSYEQGRAKFQGDTVDVIWLDEEPDIDVYSECLTRITATKGFIYMTFTPLLGMSEVVMRYLNEKSDDRGYVTMTIEDAAHIAPEERAKIIAGYPAHQRDARAKGIPMLGSGRVFQYSDDAVSEPPIEHVPAHWFKLWGVDFGIDHPFAAVLILWDKDADVIHVHHAYRQSDAQPINHAAYMKPIGERVPVAWPQDGHQRQTGSMEPIAKQYKSHGLAMMEHHATFPDGSNSTEAGIMLMDERFKNGKLKVSSMLSMWFEEFRLYHRKDGLIVKLRDDLMSATRVGIMALRHARQVPLGKGAPKRRSDGLARDIDFPLF